MGCKASKSEAQRLDAAALAGAEEQPDALGGDGPAAGLPADGACYAELPGDAPRAARGLGQVIKEFWPIGLLSFGGTQANMAMLQQMLVKDLKWVGSDQYAELLGIVQALPGASAAQILLSTVTVATGSPLAGFVAFLLFCAPGAIGMAFLGAYLAGVDVMTYPAVQSAKAGIGCAATVLVAKGAWELGQKLVADKLTKALWFLACVGCYAAASSPKVLSLVIVGGLVAGGLAATRHYDLKEAKDGAGAETAEVGINRGVGMFLVLVVCLALASLMLAPLVPRCPSWVKVASLYYKVGCLVFGGGPVVIPLLLLQLEADGVVTSDEFGLGLGAIQAFPGPMFNLAAFCGALHGGWQGALVAWAAMMAPGVLLAFGALPFWVELRGSPRVQRALKGVNACAAGLMGSAGLLLWEKLVTSPGHLPGLLATYEVRVCLTVGLLGASELSALVKPYVLILLGVAAGLAAWAAPAGLPPLG